MKYVAVLAYNGPEASEIQLDCVGVFGEERQAGRPNQGRDIDRRWSNCIEQGDWPWQ